MLNIPEQTKIAFLNDSTVKQLRIDGQYTSINDVNFYCGSYVGTNTHAESVILEATTGAHIMWWDGSRVLSDVLNEGGLSYRDYVCISMYIRFDGVNENPPSTIGINLAKYTNEAQTSWSNESKTLTVSDFNGKYKRINWIFSTTDYYGIGQVNFYSTTSTQFSGTLTIKDVQFEYGNNTSELPRDFTTNQADMYFDFDTADMFPLTNENIEFESFSLTESLCSQDNIKFGLCESAHCDFTVVGKTQNFNNQIIKPSISVNREITDEDIAKINFVYDQSRVYHAGDIWNETRNVNSTWYMPTNQWLIYTDIASYDNYFADKVYTQLEFKINSSTFDVQPKYIMLALYVECENRSSVFIRSNNLVDFDEFSNYKKLSFEFDYNTEWGKVIQVTRPYFLFYDENRNTVNVTANINYSLKNIQVLARLINNQYPAYDVNNCFVENGTLDKYIQSLMGSIPLGTFRVSDVKTENTRNMIKKHITAYDDLLLLNQNSADWYTRYMFGIDTKEYDSAYGFEYARQIYSSFWNFSNAIGLDDRKNYTEVLKNSWNWSTDSFIDKLVNMSFEWGEPNAIGKVQYIKLTANVDSSKRYVVDFDNVLNESDDETLRVARLSYVYQEYDELLRGIVKVGCVLIKEDTGNMFLCDKGDYFMLSDDCESIEIYLPYGIYDLIHSDSERLIDNVYLREVQEPIKLVNGATRLVYYQYFRTHEIFACESNITGRDVVRSLLEVCGCFFRLSREKGLPEFVYCTRYGLYPSETLYPADDLYPRDSVDGELLPLGRYVSLVSDEYRVHNYARIQILKNDKSNDTKSVCEWEYVGDRHGDNTYIIDDNIFYCADAMTYDYDNMPEVSYMLEQMFTAINNMGYVPNTVTALGMPWVECGDRIGLLTLTSGVDSFIFRRTLSGIQMLMDNYEAVGDEFTEAIKDFGYTIYTE